jgi:hypothetical protein
MEQKLLVTILPKGIKDVSDIYESKGFKNFLKKEVQKQKDKPVLSIVHSNFTAVGKGRSYFEDYIKTLPTISFDKLATSKRVVGRLVMILNIDEMFDTQKN